LGVASICSRNRATGWRWLHPAPSAKSATRTAPPASRMVRHGQASSGDGIGPAAIRSVSRRSSSANRLSQARGLQQLSHRAFAVGAAQFGQRRDPVAQLVQRHAKQRKRAQWVESNLFPELATVGRRRRADRGRRVVTRRRPRRGDPALAEPSRRSHPTALCSDYSAAATRSPRWPPT
jgi:hypothetical protein